MFSFAEIGFQEFRPRKCLGGVLREHRLHTVEEGVAGIPSAWVAVGQRQARHRLRLRRRRDPQGQPEARSSFTTRWSKALRPWRGHNSERLNIVAAIAVKRLMEREQLPGTLVVWPGIAEELLGTKGGKLVRAGLFTDVDVVLYNHVGANLGTS
ncbi:MAG: hypothetical protein R2708_01115 [Vicinamibacterales bacterium]